MNTPARTRPLTAASSAVPPTGAAEEHCSRSRSLATFHQSHAVSAVVTGLTATDGGGGGGGGGSGAQVAQSTYFGAVVDLEAGELRDGSDEPVDDAHPVADGERLRLRAAHLHAWAPSRVASASADEQVVSSVAASAAASGARGAGAYEGDHVAADQRGGRALGRVHRLAGRKRAQRRQVEHLVQHAPGARVAEEVLEHGEVEAVQRGEQTLREPQQRARLAPRAHERGRAQLARHHLPAARTHARPAAQTRAARARQTRRARARARARLRRRRARAARARARARERLQRTRGEHGCGRAVRARACARRRRPLRRRLLLELVVSAHLEAVELHDRRRRRRQH